MKDIKTIKELHDKLRELIEKRDPLKKEMMQKQREVSLLETEIIEVQDKITAFENERDICITDHAIVRYFERVLHYDITDIKDRILKSIDDIIFEKNGTCKISKGGYRVVVDNYFVKTIL